MYERREEFGYMTVLSADWESHKVIRLSFRERPTPKQMVRHAVAISKRYNAPITKPLEFIPDEMGGKFLFEVDCHNLTYKYFFDGGRLQNCKDEKITANDIKKYKEKFGTDRCIDKSFKKKFWYTDNWTGKVKEFKTVKAAVEAANQEVGWIIDIYTNYPCGKPSALLVRTEAIGFMPP